MPRISRILVTAALILFASAEAFAQYTSVSATVKDPNGNPYASGSWQANLNLANVPVGSLVKFQGSTSFQIAYVGQMDASGKFSISLPDNNVITPVGTTQWTFKFCQFYSTATQSPSPACFSLTLTITGASMDITSQVQAAAVPLSLPTVVPLPLSILNGGTGTGTPGLTFGNPVALSSPVTGFQDKGGQVFNVKAYGAKGDGTTDDTAAIQAAINAMPSCTQAGNTWTHCGSVYMPNGTYKITSTISVTSPFVSIVGESTGSTTIEAAITTGCAIDYTASPFNSGQPNTNGAGPSNLTIDGTSASAGTCGLKTHDIVGFKARGLSIANFTGVGSSGWWDDAVSFFNERFDVQMELANNTVSWLVQNSHTTGNGNTFGYGFFDLKINANAGQTAISSTGISPTFSVVMSNSLFNVAINMASTATCGSLTIDSNWNVVGNLHCEETSGSGQTGFNVDGTSNLFVTGLLDSPGPDTGSIVTMAIGSPGNMKLANPVKATAGTNQGSPPFELDGQYWNGSASALDLWTIQNVVSNGTNAPSTLTFTHGGTTGTKSVKVPNLQIYTTSGSTTFTIPPAQSDFPLITFPDATGTVAFTGANGVSAKTVSLAAGTATWTFATAYANAPTCTASDNTAANAVRVEAPLTTSVKVDGTTTDSVSIICSPAAN